MYFVTLLVVKQSDKLGNIETNLTASFTPTTCFWRDIIYEPAYPLFFKTNSMKTRKVKVGLKDEADRPIDLAGSLTTIILVLRLGILVLIKRNIWKCMMFIL